MVDFVKKNSGAAQYDDQVMQEIEHHAAEKDKGAKGVGGSNPMEKRGMRSMTSSSMPPPRWWWRPGRHRCPCSSGG